MVSLLQQGPPGPIVADYFTDVLCVWAYAGQARIDELKRHFGTQVQINYRFLPLFGDVFGRMKREWGGKGGLGAYADHVQQLARDWDHVRVHSRVWRCNVPASSFGTHRFLKAVQLWGHEVDPESESLVVGARSAFESVLWSLRKAFFADTADVGRREVQDAIAAEHGLPVNEVRAIADSGDADAALVADLELKDSQQIPGSPTLVLNAGRQRLYGNIGYSVLEANVRELLSNPRFGEASWCR